MADVKTKTKKPPKHLFDARIRGRVNNSIMERVNNTLRRRERNYSGLDVDDTPLAAPVIGVKIYLPKIISVIDT